MTWTDTGVAAATVPAGRMRGIELGSRTLVLVNLGTRWAALDGVCTHEGGVLADGELRGSEIVCPVHQAHFNAATGEVMADPDEIRPPTGTIPGLADYPVRVTQGMLQVDLPELAE